MRVLLIDADLRKPSLHEKLGVINSKGLTNYLTGNATPPETLPEDLNAQFDVHAIWAAST